MKKLIWLLVVCRAQTAYPADYHAGVTLLESALLSRVEIYLQRLPVTGLYGRQGALHAYETFRLRGPVELCEAKGRISSEVSEGGYQVCREGALSALPDWRSGCVLGLQELCLGTLGSSRKPTAAEERDCAAVAGSRLGDPDTAGQRLCAYGGPQWERTVGDGGAELCFRAAWELRQRADEAGTSPPLLPRCREICDRTLWKLCQRDFIPGVGTEPDRARAEKACGDPVRKTMGKKITATFCARRREYRYPPCEPIARKYEPGEGDRFWGPGLSVPACRQACRDAIDDICVGMGFERDPVGAHALPGDSIPIEKVRERWSEEFGPVGSDVAAIPDGTTRKPRLPRTCVDRDLMALNDAMVMNGGGNEDALRETLPKLDLGLARMTVFKKDRSRAVLFASGDGGTLVLGFRGTLGEADWETNTDLAPTRIQSAAGRKALVHRGFWEATRLYLPLLERVRDLVAEARRLGKPRPRILLTGHSLGGALAVLFAHRMAEAGLAPDEVSVFGTPRVSFEGFRELYEGYRIPTRHTYTRDDPFTVMPPFYEEPLPADHYELPVAEGADLFRRHDPPVYRAALGERCEMEYDLRARRVYEAFEKHLGRGATKREMLKLVPDTFARGLDPVLADIAKPGFRP